MRPVETETHWRIAPAGGFSEGGSNVFLSTTASQDTLNFTFDVAPFAMGVDGLVMRYFDGTSYGPVMSSSERANIVFNSIALVVETFDLSPGLGFLPFFFDARITMGVYSTTDAVTDWTFGADYTGALYWHPVDPYPKPSYDSGYNLLEATQVNFLTLRGYLPAPVLGDFSADYGSTFFARGEGSSWYHDDGGNYFPLGTDAEFWTMLTGGQVAVDEIYLYGSGNAIEPPLRLFQRDDAVGLIKTPRVAGHAALPNLPGSQQANPATRLRQGGNTYV